MNYQRIYNSIVDRARSRHIDGYVERHHIKPRCINGKNDSSNIVALTAREHFLCHWLLTRMHPTNSKLAYAFWGMCNRRNDNQARVRPSSRSYEEAREMVAKAQSQRVVTEETKRKISESMRGKTSPKSEQFIDRLLENGKATRFRKGQISSRRGIKLSAETIEKRSNSRKGYITSDETKAKIAATLKGKPKPLRDDKWKQKQREVKAGKPRTDRFTCGRCNKTIGGMGNYRRHEKSCFIQKL